MQKTKKEMVFFTPLQVTTTERKRDAYKCFRYVTLCPHSVNNSEEEKGFTQLKTWRSKSDTANVSIIFEKVSIYVVFSREKRWSKKSMKETVHVKNATDKDGGVGSREIPSAATADILIVITKVNDGSMKLPTVITELSHLEIRAPSNVWCFSLPAIACSIIVFSLE